MGSDKTAPKPSWASKSGASALDGFPRPSVAVDIVVLTVEPDAGEPSVLLVRRPGGDLALPGTFLHGGRQGRLHERETLSEAVQRCLRDKAGVHGALPEQLFVFDKPDRDERGWVLSAAHLAVVPFARLEDQRDQDLTSLLPVSAVPALPWEHNEIVDKAIATIRARYANAADPDHLLPERFTMRELMQLHDAVAGTPWPRMKFRRHMISGARVVSTGKVETGRPGKPAELFERTDPSTSRQLASAGG